MKKTTLLISTLMIFSIIFTGCSVNQTKTSEKETFSVITSIAPLYSLTKNLTKNTETIVNNIVPPGTSVHTFQISPSIAKKIEKSNLIIINGLELESFLVDTLDNHKDKIVNTSKNVPLLESNHHNEEEHHKDHEEEASHEFHDSHHEHNHGEYDPHIWLSPKNTIIQAENIKNRLIIEDSENKGVYEQNFVALKNRLELLDQDITNTLASLDKKDFIVFHNAYSYFERDYDITPSTYIRESVNKETSPQELKNIVDIIKNNNVKIIFTEPQFSPQLLKTLTEDYNLKIYTLDPLGQNLSDDTYFDMMYSNLDNIKQAFN